MNRRTPEIRRVAQHSRAARARPTPARSVARTSASVRRLAEEWGRSAITSRTLRLALEPLSERASALDVSEAFRDSPVGHPHNVDTPNVSLRPRIAPLNHRPVAGDEHVLHAERRGRRIGEELPDCLEHGLSSGVARAVRWGGVFKDAVVADAGSDCVDVVSVEGIVEPLDRCPGLLSHGAFSRGNSHLNRPQLRPARGDLSTRVRPAVGEHAADVTRSQWQSGGATRDTGNRGWWDGRLPT